jgi:pimeloyl-ACP methyl ester carboxylesterase
MPWNEEIRASWARMERLAASPATVARMLPLMSELDVRAVLPTVRVPTLVVQHTDDPLLLREWGKDVADRISAAKYVELPGRNMCHFVEPGWRASFKAIAEGLHATRGRRRASPRSSHSACPRTLRKCKPKPAVKSSSST